MKTFTLIRTDYYSVEVRAKNLTDAKLKADTEDSYLNDGEYLGSDFREE